MSRDSFPLRMVTVTLEDEESEVPATRHFHRHDRRSARCIVYKLNIYVVQLHAMSLEIL